MKNISNSGLTYGQRKPLSHLIVVAALHVAVAWGILLGTKNNDVMRLISPTGTLLVDNVAVLPAPKPPQKVVPKIQRDTVQKPELEIERQPSDAIELTATTDLSPPRQEPTTNESQVVQKKLDAAMICPTQVKPEIPRQALISGIQGLIRVEAVVQDGAVKDVRFLSGPRIFYQPIRLAMMQYKCSFKASPVIAMQEFNFHFE